MVRIFKDQGTESYVVQTTCLEPSEFLFEFADALSAAINDGTSAADLVYGALQKAMPIAYKLSGYRADEVQEQRTLVCGLVSPDSCELLGASGR